LTEIRETWTILDVLDGADVAALEDQLNSGQG